MREQTLARQKKLGIVPADTELPPINPIGTPETRSGPDGIPFPAMDETRPWDSLSTEERRLFGRMAEVYAGFLAHADHQIGRLLDYLEGSGERENTLVVVVSDNGASGEGGPHGSVNEMKFVNGVPDEMSDNLEMLDELGGPKTYNHYPNGWAMAFNTPFKMSKRYEFNGGTSDPCIISWPAGMAARGELRDQYHHAVDIVPTTLDVLDVEPPGRIKGHVQVPFDGVSMRGSFDDAASPTNRRTQFYSMLGSRGIWHDGWKAVTTHPTLSGWSHFNEDEWELYHTDVDRSEVHDLAAEHPEKVRELVNLWFAEAGSNGAFPLDDRSALEIFLTPRPVLTPARNRYVYYPDTAEVPESQSVNIRNRTFVIGAHVDLPGPGAQGVLMAQGSRFGGHALYVRDNRLHYANNFVGLGEQRVDATEDLPTGRDLLLSASFVKDGEDPPHVSTGILSLYYNDKLVGESRIRTQPGKFSLAGEGLTVGRDGGAAVSPDYPGASPWTFTGGTLLQVVVDVSGEPYVDLEREAQAMLMREQPTRVERPPHRMIRTPSHTNHADPARAGHPVGMTRSPARRTSLGPRRQAYRDEDRDDAGRAAGAPGRPDRGRWWAPRATHGHDRVGGLDRLRRLHDGPAGDLPRHRGDRRAVPGPVLPGGEPRSDRARQLHDVGMDPHPRRDPGGRSRRGVVHRQAVGAHGRGRRGLPQRPGEPGVPRVVPDLVGPHDRDRPAGDLGRDGARVRAQELTRTAQAGQDRGRPSR
jgi:arylsulfatase